MRSLPSRVWFALLIALLAAPATGWSAEGQPRSAAELLPSTCVFYLEIPQPKKLADYVLEHPLRQRLEGIPEYQKAFETPQYRELMKAVEHIEAKLQAKLPDALAKATAGGVYVGFDLARLGVAVLVRSEDEGLLAKMKDVALELGRHDAAQKGQPDPYEVKDYRGLTAYKTKEGIFAQAGPWLVISNKPDLARAVADNYLDGGSRTLAGEKNFQAARKSAVNQPEAWAWLDVESLRSLAEWAVKYPQKTDNPVAELLAGGLISAFEKSPYATLSLEARQAGLKLALRAPLDFEWIPERRNFYFGPSGEGAASRALAPPGTLLSLTTYRDLGQMWQFREELFPENVVAKLAEADSNLTTLFSGRDFGSEVLGSFAPEMQLVVARQTFAGASLVPSIKLPATALVLRLKEPEKMKRALKVQFQSLIGFINIAGAQERLPQLEMDIKEEGGTLLLSAAYLPEVDAAARTQDAIYFNLSPSMAMRDSWCVISSSKSLAVNLLDQLKTAAPNAPATGSANTELALHVPVLREVLADNQKHLVAQNMLEKGHGREEATKEIDALLGLLSWFEGASLRLHSREGQMELALELKAVK